MTSLYIYIQLSAKSKFTKNGIKTRSPTHLNVFFLVLLIYANHVVSGEISFGYYLYPRLGFTWVAYKCNFWDILHTFIYVDST